MNCLFLSNKGLNLSNKMRLSDKYLYTIIYFVQHNLSAIMFVQQIFVLVQVFSPTNAYLSNKVCPVQCFVQPTFVACSGCGSLDEQTFFCPTELVQQSTIWQFIQQYFVQQNSQQPRIPYNPLQRFLVFEGCGERIGGPPKRILKGCAMGTLEKPSIYPVRNLFRF